MVQKIIQNAEQIFPYKQALIIFMIIKYLWEQYLNLRQLQCNLNKNIPQQLKQYTISLRDFILAQSYSFDRISFEMLALSIRMAVDILCIMVNALPFIWNHVDTIFPFIDMQNQFQRAIGFVLIQSFKNKAFDVPISVYQTFVIEKKHNFTNKTLDLFIYDLIVQAALTLIIIPPIIFGYLRVVELGGQYFYFFLQIFILIVTLILSWVHPNFIAPLFNDFKDLQDSTIRGKLHHLANKTHFPLKNIFRINSSVRSAHSNAYFYGFGKSKMIVLYDTLIDKLTADEITSVISHQIGHWYHSHSFKKLCIHIIQALSIFYIFSFFLKNHQVFISFGFHQYSETFIGTALFFYLFEPLTSIFSTSLLILTRTFQFQADTYACENGYGQQLKSALVKLFRESTSTAIHDPLFAWLKNSHPTIYERVANIDRQLQKKML